MKRKFDRAYIVFYLLGIILRGIILILNCLSGWFLRKLPFEARGR
jgi:hypothetical protein